MAGYDAADLEFHQLIGQIVVTWNACEGRLREMVIWLAGGRSPSNLALTAHMTAKALSEALPAMSGKQPAEVREHLEYYAKAVDILREHRNYYVHGITAISVSMIEPDTSAWLQTVTGKQRVKIHSERVGLGPLKALEKQLVLFSYYGLRVLEKVDPYRGMFGFGARRHVPATWPKKPPLPDRLRKPPPILLGAPPQPESSGE
jgi:hypothetical protein